MINYNTEFFDLPPEDHEKHSNAILGISLLQEYNYSSTINRAVQSHLETFDNVQMLVADSLIEYVFLALGFTDEDAIKKTKEEIDKWKNNPFVEKILSNDRLDVIYWDDIKRTDEFKTARSFIDQLYLQNTKFSNIIDVTATIAHAKNY